MFLIFENMNTDKAYLLGLIIGGGKFSTTGNDFFIDLPYKKWGSYTADPIRAGGIARDILKKVGQMFKAIYNLSIQYETLPSGNWKILFEGDLSTLKNDLLSLGIKPVGTLRGNIDLAPTISTLIDDNFKRRFIAGLADTIGSVAKSHRRFSDEHQIISFEIPGFNYKFVCNLCNLLYSVNCIPDQINWNHPNIHSTNDSYYKQWKKGFKIRVLLDQYAKFGAFAFRTKVESTRENLRLQNEVHSAEKCEERDFHITPSTIHPAEHANILPENIRDGHYIHFRHFCTVLGCPHAPYDQILEKLQNIGNYINPFPILHKDNFKNILDIIDTTFIYKNRKYSLSTILVNDLVLKYHENSNQLLYGKSKDTGYPIGTILQGIAYVIAEEIELRGTKIKGNYIDLIQNHLLSDPDLTVEFMIPDLLTPLIIKASEKAAMVGPLNPKVYEKLTYRSSDNQYKLLIRDIEEKDLYNEKT